MPCDAVAVCVLVLLGFLVGEVHGLVRASRARLAHLHRAQERWAAELDRGADRQAPTARRLTSETDGGEGELSQGGAGCDRGERGSILVWLVRIIHEQIVFAQADPDAVERFAARMGVSMETAIAYRAATQILDDFTVAEIPDDFDLVEIPDDFAVAEPPAGEDDLGLDRVAGIPEGT